MKSSGNNDSKVLLALSIAMLLVSVFVISGAFGSESIEVVDSSRWL